MKIDWEILYPELKLQVERIIDENKVLSVYLIGSGIKKLNSQDEFVNMRDVDILVIVESGDPEREVIEHKGIVYDVSYLDSGFVCEFKDYENSFLYAAWRKKYMLYENKKFDFVERKASDLGKRKTDKAFSPEVGGFLLGDWKLNVDTKFKEWKEQSGVSKEFKELQLVFILESSAFDIICLLFKFDGRWPVAKKKFIDELLTYDRDIFDLFKNFMREKTTENKYHQFELLVEASAKKFGGVRRLLDRSYFHPEL